ncbi:hypothetical protein [Emticicia sp. W12TSBA100-4]|uniref:hypothetical protein n=1 Tax=Emticicia sp. W12TSBA100-4 TaxID=3160965 RepID=UPI003305C31F
MKKIFLLLILPFLLKAQNITTSGKIGVGLDNPVSKMQVNQVGNYNVNENTQHAFLIKDPNATTPHFLYMGSDAANGLSYIQSVAQGAFKPLLLQGRGGNVGIGILYPTQKLEVYGNIRNTGDLFVQFNKGIVRNSQSTQLKTVFGTIDLLLAVQNISIAPNSLAGTAFTFNEAFPVGTVPNVSLGGIKFNEFVTQNQNCVKIIYNVVNITNTGGTISLFNPTNTAITFDAQVNFIAIGQAQ